MNDNKAPQDSCDNVIRLTLSQQRSFEQKAAIATAKVLANAGLKLLIEAGELLSATGETYAAEIIAEDAQELLDIVNGVKI